MEEEKYQAGEHELVLVRLEGVQIKKAKEINGQKKQITHGLICGPYGQIFGTEKQCRKYYSAWSEIFPFLFVKAFETDTYVIKFYATTFNLVNDLISAHDRLQSEVGSVRGEKSPNSDQTQPGLLSWLFRK